MKTNVSNLSAANRTTLAVASWLSSRNALLSEYLGCRISNLSFVGVIAFGVLTFATILLASDACQAYGWAAFTGLAAINSVISLFREFNKEVDHEG